MIIFQNVINIYFLLFPFLFSSHDGLEARTTCTGNSCKLCAMMATHNHLLLLSLPHILNLFYLWEWESPPGFLSVFLFLQYKMIRVREPSTGGAGGCQFGAARTVILRA